MATEKDFEREQVEWVFGVVGELETEPLRPVDSSGSVWVCSYWYEGRREDRGGTDDRYITIFRDCMFGAPPETITVDGDEYQKIESGLSSGETECPGRDDEDGADECPLKDAGDIQVGNRCPHCDSWAASGMNRDHHHRRPIGLVKADQATERGWCGLCEAKVGEPHGFIYIGDGWMEIVYEKVDRVEEAVENWNNGNRKDAIKAFLKMSRDEQETFWDGALAGDEDTLTACLLAVAVAREEPKSE